MRSAAACSASAALAALGLAAAAAAATPELDEILRRMASARGVEAPFEERKEIALLAQPLETRGVIYFVPPDRFARFTTSPGASALVVRVGLAAVALVVVVVRVVCRFGHGGSTRSKRVREKGRGRSTTAAVAAEIDRRGPLRAIHELRPLGGAGSASGGCSGGG